jgi:hypothetical protein
VRQNYNHDALPFLGFAHRARAALPDLTALLPWVKDKWLEVDWTVTTPSVTAAPDGPGEQRQGTPAACAATRSTEAGRGTTGYYMERPARAESSLLRGLSPGRDGLDGSHAPAGIALVAGEARCGPT